LSTISQAIIYGRFLRGLPRYLREPVTLTQARESVRSGLRRREENFTATVEKLIFGVPSSPYLPLLELAGCSVSDFRALVKDRGVEGSLRRLREEGVYFTFEEYKGRTPVMRSGREFPIQEWQFDNPFLTHYYRNSSSGSTGSATATSTDLVHLAGEASHRMLLLDSHGLSGAPFSVWRPALPSGSGLNNVLRQARMGRPVDRWFTPLVPGEYRTALRYRLATAATIRVGRACGSDLVQPEPVALDDAVIIARYLADTVRAQGGACLSTTVSCGLRISLAAREAGLGLDGASLMVAGEPPTVAKVRGMERSGAHVFSDYGAVETGRVALGCTHPDHHTDMHVTTDTVALILFPRTVPESGETVNSIHITSLVPTMPKLLLNMELDDFGEMQERDCGCPLGALGLRTHLWKVRSYRKLVSEGVTLIGSDMIRILEEVLPERFGGSPLDYQLVEDENEDGFTRLSLHIDPRLSLPSDEEVVSAILDALTRANVAAALARAHWAAAGSFRIVRESPRVSPRGKQAPLRVVRP